MAFSETKLLEVGTRLPAVVVEIHRYTKLAGDATGTITRSKGRKIRKILTKSDGSAVATINANLKQVDLTSLAAAGNDSLTGFVVIEVERI